MNQATTSTTHWSRDRIFKMPGSEFCVQNYLNGGGGCVLHSHDFYEFAVVTNGNGIHENEKGITTLIQGDVFAVEPGKRHAYTSYDRMRVCNIMFTEEFLNSVWDELKGLAGIRALLAEQKKLHLPHAEYRRVEKLIYAVIEEQKLKQAGFRCICRGYFYELMALFGRLEPGAGETAVTLEPDARTGIGHAIRYMEKHYAERIDLAMLSAQAQMSRSNFCSSFKALTGTSAGNFLKELRVEEAKSLLSSTNLSLAAVAERCGFCDSSHMVKLFREHTGMTPQGFRREQAAETTRFFTRHDAVSS